MSGGDQFRHAAVLQLCFLKSLKMFHSLRRLVRARGGEMEDDREAWRVDGGRDLTA